MMGYLLKTWDELAIGQRFSFVTLTAIGLTLIAMLLYGYRSVGDLLVGLFVGFGILGLALNADTYRKTNTFEWANMPRHCKILYQLAIGCLLIRGAKTVIDALTIG